MQTAFDVSQIIFYGASIDRGGSPRSRSSSRDTTTSASRQRLDSAFHSPAGDALALETEEAMLDRVAARVIEQHDIYSVPMLERFVEQNYPFVSEKQRRALAIGATTGARQVARLYYMVREYDSSDSAVRSQSADNARRGISVHDSLPTRLVHRNLTWPQSPYPRAPNRRRKRRRLRC